MPVKLMNHEERLNETDDFTTATAKHDGKIEIYHEN